MKDNKINNLCVYCIMDYYSQYTKYLNRYIVMKGGGKKYYYHGSPQKIDILQPRSLRTAVIEGEAVVFATNTKWLAIYFIASNATDDDIELGFISGIPFILEQYEGAFSKFLKGKSGYVHYVDPKYFKKDDRLGMEQEFISYKPVPVLKVEKIDDIYEKLKQEDIHMLKWKQNRFGKAELEWEDKEKILYKELVNKN